MSSQGSTSQQGVPRSQRPKFNFNSRDVKKDLTPDLMAAQLASFGSSAKLKPMPAPQPAENQLRFPNPAGQQFHGQASMYTSPQMFTQQALFQNQQAPFPRGYGTGYNTQVMPQQQTLLNQAPVQGLGFSQGFRQPAMAGEVIAFPPQATFPATNNFLKTDTSFSVPLNNQQSPSLQQNFSTLQTQSTMQNSSSSQPLAQSTSSFDMFASFGNVQGTAASSIDPFAGLSKSSSQACTTTQRSSSSGAQITSSITIPAQSSFHDFAAFPEVASTTTSSANSQKHDDFFGGSDSQNLFGFSASLSSSIESRGPAKNQSTIPSTSMQFDNDFFSSNSIIQTGSGFMQPSTQAPSNTSVTGTMPQSSVQSLDLFGSVPFSSSNQSTKANSPNHEFTKSAVDASQKGQISGFDDIFGPSSATSSSVFPIQTPTVETVPSFAAFEDNFNLTPHTVKSEPKSESNFNVLTSSLSASEPPSVPTNVHSSAPISTADTSPPIDLFGSAPFSTNKPATQTIGAASATSNQQPHSMDKYSVFGALQEDASSSTDMSSLAAFSGSTTSDHPATKPAVPGFQPVMPVEPFQQSNFFDDAFDPFNTKEEASSLAPTASGDQFAVFDSVPSFTTPSIPERPVASAPATHAPVTHAPVAVETVQSSSGSIVRARPTAKTADSLVMLPPPSTERRRPNSSNKMHHTKPVTTTQAQLISTKPTTQPVTQPPLAVDLFGGPSAGFDDVFDQFSTHNPISGKVGDTDLFSSTEVDGGVFGKPGRLEQTKQQQQQQPVKSMSGTKARTKRPAPKPPSSTRGNGSTFYTPKPPEVSLLDVDFSLTNESATQQQQQPQQQLHPLLILPSPADSKKKLPPARPPPPKSLTITSAESPQDLDSVSPQVSSLLQSGPPPLPPRPGPEHSLYNYIVQTGPHALALFEFEAEIEDELDFKAGDVIKLDNEVSDEWYAGSIGTRRGIFPKNLVEVRIPLSQGAISAVSSPSPDITTDFTPKVDWGAPQPKSPSPDLFNAWGDTRTPSPPPSDHVPEEAPKSLSPDPPSPVPPVETPAVALETVIDTCTVIYAFKAQESDELDVEEGDIVDVLEFIDDDWIKGRLGDKVGIFPRGFALIGDEEAPPPIDEIVDDSTRSVSVLYDFEAGAPDELSLVAGEMVQVVGVFGDEWLKGRIGENEGIFPASFVPEIPPHWNLPDISAAEHSEVTEDSSSSSSSDESDEVMSVMSEDVRSNAEHLGRVQVVADFEAENDFEMSVKTGDIVTVTAKLNELWLEGECDGHTGILPSNFVRWIDSPMENLGSIVTNQACDTAPELSAPDGTSHDLPPPPQQHLQPLDDVTGELSSLLTDSTAPEQPVTPFSEGNPFAEISGPGDARDTHDDHVASDHWSTAAAEVDPDKTLVNNPENPFTEDIVASGDGEAIDSDFRPGTRLRTLYSFEPENDDELCFQQGQIVEVTEYLNEDWLRGRVVEPPTQAEGVFPSSYAQRIELD